MSLGRAGAREVEEALARLGGAGRRLARWPARERLEALACVLDSWGDPTGPARRALAEELPVATGFAPQTVLEGLARGFAPLHGAALRELVDRELGGLASLDARGPVAVSGFAHTAVLLAGAIPPPTLLALVMPLVVGSPVLAKTSAADPVTAHAVQRSLAAVDPLLGACLEVVSFPSTDEAALEALLRAECVVATGSDASVAAVSARVAPPRRLVRYGHRVSVAVLARLGWDTASFARVASALALDVALWDQLGCLSPVAVYVLSEEPDAAPRVARALGDALAEAERRWPRGRLDVAAAAALEHEREEARLRAAAGRPVELRRPADGRWTVVCEEDARPRPAPLYRFVRVHPVADRSELERALAPLGPHLAGVALAADAEARPGLSRSLSRLGASRVCAPGTLQAPPLGWHHDNRGVLLPVARLCDLPLP